MLLSANKLEFPRPVYDRLEEFITGCTASAQGCTTLAKERTSPKATWTKDIPTARDNKFLVKLGSDVNLSVLELVASVLPDHKCVLPSGHWLYPAEGGFMGWHTNSDAPFERVYLVYSDTGESWFNYYCTREKRVVKVKDEKGWNVYHFETPKDPLFWHCVYTECDRYSFGFRIV